MVDSSERAKRKGVYVHVVRAGEFKGTGVEGTPIDAKQRAELQRTVDTVNDHFVTAVAAGRKIHPRKARDLADGRVHVGMEAVRMGLIDGVDSFDGTLARLAQAT